MNISRMPYLQQAGEQWRSQGCLSSVGNNDFEKSLQAIEALYAHPNFVGFANDGITLILQYTEIDIGIRWENGRFLPSGAPVLDQRLVDDVLGILSSLQYKSVSDSFEKGLGHFLNSL